MEKFLTWDGVIETFGARLPCVKDYKMEYRLVAKAKAEFNDRKDVYEAAKQRHPQRWTGTTRDWQSSKEVWLNPERKLPEELRKAA